jgi:hypothetical protein
MAVAEQFFAEDPHGPFPDKGQLVCCRLRDGSVIAGTVSLVWMGMEVCIDVATAEGIRRCYPALGDRWEALDA